MRDIRYGMVTIGGNGHEICRVGCHKSMGAISVKERVPLWMKDYSYRNPNPGARTLWLIKDVISLYWDYHNLLEFD